jgi:hypothetical protein
MVGHAGCAVDGEKHAHARRVGDIRVARAGQLPDLAVADLVGEIEIELAVGSVVGMEREAEQAALAFVRKIGRRDVEERLRGHLARGEIQDDYAAAVLLENEQPVGVAWGRRREERRVQSRGDEVGLDRHSRHDSQYANRRLWSGRTIAVQSRRYANVK